MSAETSIQTTTINSTKTVAITTTTLASDGRRKQCIAENNLILWVDKNIDLKLNEFQNTLTALRKVVNEVTPCNTTVECIECLNRNQEETAFIICSGALGQYLIPEIHNRPQLEGIYVFCHNKEYHEQWTKDWIKIRGVYTSILPICEILPLAIEQSNQDKTSISIINTNEGSFKKELDQLPPTFMYSQIFKEILLDMKYDTQAIKDFVTFCQDIYQGNENELQMITEFKNTYRPSSAIFWYTRDCFVYKLLNGALRTLNGDTIIRAGFLVSAVERQIKSLHKKQISRYNEEPFIVYRGQGILNADFENLEKNQDGLISFNSFLSTSMNQNVALAFAKNALKRTQTVGTFFQMTIDPRISSTPFASIKDISEYEDEQEILFSMHSVFRIGKIQKLSKKHPLYQVDLQLTSDDDQQLSQLTEHIKNEAANSTGWARLASLLYKIGQFKKAEELYLTLLHQAPNDKDRAEIDNQLGMLKRNQAEYKEALIYYEEALEIYEKTCPKDHPDLAPIYCSIGLVYVEMYDYSKALEYFRKTLKIDKTHLPEDHINLASSYNNIGLVYNNMHNYPKALEFYNKAHNIKLKTLHSYHMELAVSYNNIGHVYKSMGEYSQALEFYEQAHQIKQKVLPSNHPELGVSYNNMGWVYKNMNDNGKALHFLEKALAIWHKSLPPTHPHIKQVITNINHIKKELDKK